MTSASHAEGRQFDPGQVYVLHSARLRRCGLRRRHSFSCAGMGFLCWGVGGLWCIVCCLRLQFGNNGNATLYFDQYKNSDWKMRFSCNGKLSLPAKCQCSNQPTCGAQNVCTTRGWQRPLQQEKERQNRPHVRRDPRTSFFN